MVDNLVVLKDWRYFMLRDDRVNNRSGMVNSSLVMHDLTDLMRISSMRSMLMEGCNVVLSDCWVMHGTVSVGRFMVLGSAMVS